MAAPDLQLVADVYTEAATSSHAPLLAVERHFGISRSTAGRWVAKARAAGLLEQVTQGSRPLNWKLVAVAKDLGVKPMALRDAVVRHAIGDLRVRRG